MTRPEELLKKYTKVKFFNKLKKDEKDKEFIETDFTRHIKSEGTSDKVSFLKSKWFLFIAALLLISFIYSMIKSMIYIAVIIGIIFLVITIKRSI